MERIRVVSSNIASIGYDVEDEVLEVEFKGGSVYRYSGVPVEEHKGLMSAPSIGRYFQDHIKKGPYPYIEVIDEKNT